MEPKTLFLDTRPTTTAVANRTIILKAFFDKVWKSHRGYGSPINSMLRHEALVKPLEPLDTHRIFSNTLPFIFSTVGLMSLGKTPGLELCRLFEVSFIDVYFLILLGSTEATSFASRAFSWWTPMVFLDDGWNPVPELLLGRGVQSLAELNQKLPGGRGGNYLMFSVWRLSSVVFGEVVRLSVGSRS